MYPLRICISRVEAKKLVEKTRFPRLVVGESLIPRVMDHFEEAGFLPALEAQKYEVKWERASFVASKYVSSIFLEIFQRLGLDVAGASCGF